MKQVSISPSILFWAAGIAVGVWLLFAVREVIVLFLIALLISAAMEPAIRRVRKRGVSRTVAAGAVFVFFLAVIVGLFSYLIPIIADETRSFARELPRYAREITGSDVFFEDASRQFLDWFEGNSFAGIPQGVFSTTLGAFGAIVSTLAVLSMAFYLSLYEGGMEKVLRFATPPKYRPFVLSRARKVYDNIGRWMFGQFILMFIVFVAYYVMLASLGVPNALVLAVFGGLLEIIPFFGPIISAIPAILLGFLVSPLTGVIVWAGYIIIQQVENHVLVPQIMKRAVGVNPVIVILSLFAGAKIAGIAGMILAVPVAMGVRVFLKGSDRGQVTGDTEDKE